MIVVVPCYQGAATVGAVVHGARAAGLDVVVVDDGSTDNSGAIGEAAGATVLRHPGNRGKGAALASGFAWAARHDVDAVLTMDADGQHDPAEIPALRAAHAAAPTALVIGVRSFAPEDMPRRSRIGNRISTWWISRFAGRSYRDTQSGYRVYPRALFDVPLRSTKFDTEAELLLRAAKMKLPLVEVPIRTIYGPNRVTHFHGFRDTMRVIKLVFFSPLWSLVLAASLLSAGCASSSHAPGKVVPVHGSAPVMPVTQSWRTMRAEHQVRIEVKTASGTQTKTIRGLLAVQRPDRFRLRALGPAGITLFDVIVVAGQVTIVQSLRDPNDPTMGRILESLARDLEATYDLLPRPPERHIGRVGDEVVVEEPGLKIRETKTHFDIDDQNEHFKVHVEVGAVDKDVALDPAMWSK
ncbi:MAG TPA: glycosyltransferase family 2 protein [Polyangia bacterium]|nr:glycosyltransferase family 2 protein [Polyangia bacterium]